MRFDEPVFVFVGLGFPRSITSVADAHAFLCDWPQSKRDAAHAVALAACLDTLAGARTAQEARRLFTAFARRNRILAPATGGLVAARATGALPVRAAMRVR